MEEAVLGILEVAAVAQRVGAPPKVWSARVKRLERDGGQLGLTLMATETNL